MEVHRIPVLIGAVGRAALDFLLPPTCVACEGLLDNGERGLVCGRCWARLAMLPSPQCARCGHPSGRAACSWCHLLPRYVRSVRSVCWTHAGTGSAIVHALKYGGWHAAAHGMAERLARLALPADVLASPRVLLPVPLSPGRARERGFNQSERLASFLAERWNVPVRSDVLERTRSTETQTQLTPEQRLTNVSGAFRARDVGPLEAAHTMIVDDVVTTAATLNACAAALAAAGVRSVSYVTFGRAPTSADRRAGEWNPRERRARTNTNKSI